MRRRRVRLVVAAVTLTITAAVGTGPAGRPTASASGPDLPVVVESTTTYRPVPAEGSISAQVRTTITNQASDRVRGNVIESFVLPDFGIPVVAEAEGFAARTESGRALTVSVQDLDVGFLAAAVVDLVPDLSFGRTETIVLSYEIPAQAPRSPSATRVNPAFVTFPAFAVGDPGLTTIEVAIPDGFEVEIVGDPLEPEERDGTTFYVAEAIDDPFTFTSFVVITDDDALDSRSVAVGDAEVSVRGWPDDGAWVDFVADRVERGVPVLEELVGLPWPATDEFEIIETVSPYLYGYAGWYTPDDESIEVGDELEPIVILHELGHLWFNDELFAGRWVNEGFAEVYAAAALDKLGDETASPVAPDAGHPGRIALDDWSNPVLQGDLTAEREAYGYATSWWLFDEIVDEVGFDALGEVIRAASERDTAYRGDGPPETVPGSADWRRLLDLLTDVGGSETAVALFGDHVVGDGSAPLLDDRAAAREAYAALVADGGEWSAPWAVRRAMGNWRFDLAGSLISQAAELLVDRDALLATAAPLDLDLGSLERDFESTGDLDEFVGTFRSADLAVSALVEVDDDADPGANPLALVAYLGHGPDDDVADAVSAFEDGDFTRSIELAADARDAVDEATIVGMLRLVAVAGIVGVGLAGRRVRRRLS